MASRPHTPPRRSTSCTRRSHTHQRAGPGEVLLEREKRRLAFRTARSCREPPRDPLRPGPPRPAVVASLGRVGVFWRWEVRS